jgi:hypothetical protein
MQHKSVNEVSFGEFFIKTGNTIRYLLSKWMIIAIVCIIFGLLGVLYAWIKKPLYVAEMSFVTDTESKGTFSAYAGLAAQFGLDLGGGNSTLFEGDNLIELLKSKNLVMQTLLSPVNIQNDQRLMIDLYLEEVANDDKYTGKNIFSKAHIISERTTDSILLKVTDEIITKDLFIEKRDKKLSIIDLRMQSHNEYFSKRFSELLAEKAIHYYTDYKIKKSRQNVAILEKQTDSVRRILYGNISEVASMNDLNVNPVRQITRTGSQRKQVEVQASGALYGELLKNLELSRLSLRKETPLIQVVDTPILPLEKKGIGRLFAGLLFAAIGGGLFVLLLLIKRNMGTKLLTNEKAAI